MKKKKNLRKKLFKIIEKENITIDLNKLENSNYARYSFIFCENTNKEKRESWVSKICKYFHERSKELIFSKPIETIRYVTKKTLSFVFVKPASHLL